MNYLKDFNTSEPLFIVIWFIVCKFYEMQQCNNGGCRNVAQSQQRANRRKRKENHLLNYRDICTQAYP